MIELFFYLLVGLCVLVSFVLLHVYINARDRANLRLASAVRRFHDAADKLLKTPGDLPVPLARAISGMAKLAFRKETSHFLFAYLREDTNLTALRNSKTAEAERASDKYAAIKAQLRPELRPIVAELALAWFSIATDRNVLLAHKIRRELRRLSKDTKNGGAQKRIEDSEERFVLSFFLNHAKSDARAA